MVLAPISRAFARRASKSSPTAPETAATWLMDASKSAVVFTAAVPRARIGAVTFRVKEPPTEDILLPTDSSVLPASPILVSAVFASAASRARRFSSSSVAMISRWSASYLSLPRSPDSICAFACSCACFSASSFSLVAEMAVFSLSCFWLRSSVLVGSSLRRRSTSFSWLWVFLMVLLTDSSALDKPVVEPLISTVIPAILFGIYSHLLSQICSQIIIAFRLLKAIFCAILFSVIHESRCYLCPEKQPERHPFIPV